MTPIYANRPFARRMNASAAVAIAAFFYGFWELWMAVEAGPGHAGYGFVFAVLFIGGGLYGLWQLSVDFRSTVIAVDAQGASGRAVISIWRPFFARRIEGDLSQLTGWRFKMKTERRGIQVPTLLADHPDASGPLQLELGKGIAVTDALRALAPDALAEYEKTARSGG